jgi:hypothetical protein
MPTSTSAQCRPLDFAAIKTASQCALPGILARILPGGRTQGGEYIVRNPRRHDRTPGSFKVRVHGSRSGSWADFATGDRGGDAISLVAFLDSVSQGEAATRLGRLLNIT